MNPWESTPGHYAGIGSRKTPAEILARMTKIARELSERRWILRSGGARGADQAFESGIRKSQQDSLLELFIPQSLCIEPSPIEIEARGIAAIHHPSWSRLNTFDRWIHTRNVFQVLGRDLKTPSRFVLCWTPDGSTGETTSTTGGTGQAIRVAKAHSVPIYNLADKSCSELWNDFLSSKIGSDAEYLDKVFE